MKREIKFRAWTGKEMVLVGSLEFFIGPNSVVVNNEFPNCVLMQFTGLKDKNGKEIYDGDVVELDENSEFRYTVRYIGSSFVLEYITSEAAIEYLLDKYSKFCEVIGNIYEPPELIKMEAV